MPVIRTQGDSPGPGQTGDPSQAILLELEEIEASGRELTLEAGYRTRNRAGRIQVCPVRRDRDVDHTTETFDAIVPGTSGSDKIQPAVITRSRIHGPGEYPDRVVGRCRGVDVVACRRDCDRAGQTVDFAQAVALGDRQVGLSRYHIALRGSLVGVVDIPRGLEDRDVLDAAAGIAGHLHLDREGNPAAGADVERYIDQLTAAAGRAERISLAFEQHDATLTGAGDEQLVQRRIKQQPGRAAEACGVAAQPGKGQLARLLIADEPGHGAAVRRAGVDMHAVGADGKTRHAGKAIDAVDALVDRAEQTECAAGRGCAGVALQHDDPIAEPGRQVQMSATGIKADGRIEAAVGQTVQLDREIKLGPGLAPAQHAADRIAVEQRDAGRRR